MPIYGDSSTCRFAIKQTHLEVIGGCPKAFLSPHPIPECKGRMPTPYARTHFSNDQGHYLRKSLSHAMQ